jgi:hypothetical protein
VLRVVRRRRQADSGDPADDHGDADDLGPAEALMEEDDGDRKQEDEAERHDRLDERQRRKPERDDLKPPAAPVERDSREPHPALDEHTQKGDSQEVPIRGAACLEGLERDTRAVESRRRERGSDAE